MNELQARKQDIEAQIAELQAEERELVLLEYLHLIQETNTCEHAGYVFGDQMALLERKWLDHDGTQYFVTSYGRKTLRDHAQLWTESTLEFPDQGLLDGLGAQMAVLVAETPEDIDKWPPFSSLFPMQKHETDFAALENKLAGMLGELLEGGDE